MELHKLWDHTGRSSELLPGAETPQVKDKMNLRNYRTGFSFVVFSSLHCKHLVTRKDVPAAVDLVSYGCINLHFAFYISEKRKMF